MMLTLGLFINANGQTNVTTGNHRAVVEVKDNASWAEAASNVNLMIDWKKLELNPSKCSVYFSEVKNFQNASKQKLKMDPFME